MEKKELKYEEVFNRDNIYSALPLSGLKGDMLADVIMLQVDYAAAINEYETRMQSALEKLKEELCPDFDEQFSLPEKERKEGFAEDERKLLNAYSRLRVTEGAKECPARLRSLTQEEFRAICGAGAEGDVRLKTGESVPLAAVLRTAAMMIDKEENKE